MATGLIKKGADRTGDFVISKSLVGNIKIREGSKWHWFQLKRWCKATDLNTGTKVHVHGVLNKSTARRYAIRELELKLAEKQAKKARKKASKAKKKRNDKKQKSSDKKRKQSKKCKQCQKCKK